MKKPRRVNEISEADKVRRVQELDDIKFIMGNAAGRRFVWRLLEEGNIFRKVFTGNSETFYLEGKREFMIPFYSDIMEACPDKFWVAQQENFKPKEISENADSRTTGATDTGHE